MISEHERRRAGCRLAAEAIARGRPLDWFEELYAAAERDPAGIAWADLAPNPSLIAWCERRFPASPVAYIVADAMPWPLTPAELRACVRRLRATYVRDD